MQLRPATLDDFPAILALNAVSLQVATVAGVT